MITQELINRINELSKKKKSVGLTPEEEKEQKVLYKEYLEGFRANFKKQLENIDVLDPKKVLLGFSGGVDSTASAIKLKEAGFDVTGYYFDITGTVTNEQKEAEKTAKELGIPLIVESVKEDFESIVVDNFIKEYIKGRTPNPCIVCNPNIKFKKLLENANKIGAYYIATGHYARVGKSEDKYYICQAKNLDKDQSYMLYRLNQEVIKRLIFPLGDVLSKDDTRTLVKEMGINNYEKGDSQEICFVDESDNYVDYIKRKGYTSKEGVFIDKSGNILGKHKGIVNYTIGQRKGLGIALGKPVFVTNIDSVNNTITLGDNDDLFTNKVTSIDNFSSAHKIEEFNDLTVLAKVRYSACPTKAKLEVSGNEITASFDIPQRAVTPGQSIVFYINDKLIGGGIIK